MRQGEAAARRRRDAGVARRGQRAHRPLYGHFDVQPPDPLDLWDPPPFEPTERDGWLYARGIADDKGQLYMLLEAARRLAAAGELPVNVRFACDGEEETGGHSIVEFLAADERGADAAIIFDSGMIEPRRARVQLALRGMRYFHVERADGRRDLHSGMYGGAALNAMHALMQALGGGPARGTAGCRSRCGPASHRRPRRSSPAGRTLPPGADELPAQGATPDGRRAQPRSSTCAPAPSPPST